jgi:hypothetical protein
MVKFYLVVVLAVLMVGAYISGRKIATADCWADMYQQQNVRQMQINQKLEGINEKVVRSSTDDIRRVLCEKYTIAE